MSKLSILGDNIKNIRKSKKITRENLSLELGISVHTLSKYEQGQREPNIEMLNKIAKALDINVSDLISRKENVEISLSQISTKDLINELHKRLGDE